MWPALAGQARLHVHRTAAQPGSRVGHRRGRHRGVRALVADLDSSTRGVAATATTTTAAAGRPAAAARSTAALRTAAEEGIQQAATATAIAAAIAGRGASAARGGGTAATRVDRTAATGVGSAPAGGGATRLAAAVTAEQRIQQPRAAPLLAAARIGTSARRIGGTSAAWIHRAAAAWIGGTATRLLTTGLRGTGRASTPGPQHTVEQLEAEALAANTDADDERCAEHIPLHRTTSPLHWNLPRRPAPRLPTTRVTARRRLVRGLWDH
jgi:hypothetical protein